jgi:hypothetical protein
MLRSEIKPGTDYAVREKRGQDSIAKLPNFDARLNGTSDPSSTESNSVANGLAVHSDMVGKVWRKTSR